MNIYTYIFFFYYDLFIYMYFFIQKFIHLSIK